MNGDFTRITFRPRRHYSALHLQQGRVLLDAEWNEQVAIDAQRDRLTTRDVVGESGAPWTPPGEFANFNIRESGNSFEIAPGHFYLDGLLASNETVVFYEAQPDYPGPPPLVDGQDYVVYLDLWQRHLTALEQPAAEQPRLREVALGGPDSATRSKQIWQAKVQAIEPGLTCADFGSGWLPDGAQSTGALRARAVQAPDADNDCLVPEGGGYRRLENQLYRVEIHKPGAPGVATWKMSRDNASILTRLLVVDTTDPAAPILTVENPGKDETLAFAAAQWVEVSDEGRTLRNEPGDLLEVTSVKGDRIVLANPGLLPLAFGDGATVRRWDGTGVVQIGVAPDSLWIDLEDGVQIEFADGAYLFGDYWTIPARTLTGAVEWQQDDAAPPEPLFEARHGTEHRYCALALLTPLGDSLWQATDCRPTFPAITQLTTLLYEGGDGQEALPNGATPLPLRVRVVNGQAPVFAAQVLFTVIDGGGAVASNSPVPTTAPDGIAECGWTLGAAGLQQVQATLLDGSGAPIPGQVIDFTATVSLASGVAYQPGACDNLAAATTVQEALDILCQTAGGAPKEEAIRIVSVRTLWGNQEELANDSIFYAVRLAEGIHIEMDREFDATPFQDRVGLPINPVCTVTLDLPAPPSSLRDHWQAQYPYLGFQPTILAANIRVDPEASKYIDWFPFDSTAEWLRRYFPRFLNRFDAGIPGVLAHLTIRGNFIWARETDPFNPEIYLDGNTYGQLADDGSVGIRMPSGNGRRGGNFEMWFWLLPGEG